jgi:hypothetical protein
VERPVISVEISYVRRSEFKTGRTAMVQQVAQEPAEAARGFGFDIRDPQRFAQNMARLVEESAKAVTAFAEPRVTNPAQALAGGGDFTHIMNALSQIQQAWFFQPQKLMEAQAELWQRYWQLWTSALGDRGGGARVPEGGPADRGRVPRLSCRQASADRGDRVRGGDGHRLGILDRARDSPVSGVLGGRNGQRY